MDTRIFKVWRYYRKANEHIKRKTILIENKNNFLDIDNIFLNIPTPK